jgi:hypothetical protein
MTLPRIQMRIRSREASWSAALLCRFHPFQRNTIEVNWRQFT